ncbi:MAG: UDP-N-acetylmuramoyl-tripeptide--D-alanyl-D-alanine ligase [Sedimentisphaerales bacterium]|nr:UDP-N-acetylmuramoyl-tripeptide--D-alanyl-D-alanine ligase [Sedimentisphaerales bacterium]
MKEFSITALIQATGAKVDASTANSVFTGISIDSRTVKPGDCFFAVKGETFDGHDYLAEAFAKGAACAVVAETAGTKGLDDKTLLKVDDTIEALGRFAREYRRQMGFKVITITGSAGKTTTRQMAAHVLGRRFCVHQSPKSFNNNIGVPLTLLSAGTETEIVVAELGSNHPGEIANLTRIALPDIAVVTNVHPAHLEGFGNLDTIVAEKLSISEGLGPGGTMIVNADFPSLVAACRSKGIEFVTFGKTETADYQGRDITSDGLTSRFSIGSVEVRLGLAGAGNVENALAAWAACSRLGVKAEDFAQALRSLPGVSMRAEILEIGTLTVINDCYNANPASMANALDILARLQARTGRRSVFICGDMGELGPRSESLHIELGASIARAKIHVVVAAGRLAGIAAAGARDNAEYDLQIRCFEDGPSACNNLAEIVKDYDIVLVKGSRSARLETAVDKLKELFA